LHLFAVTSFSKKEAIAEMPWVEKVDFAFMQEFSSAIETGTLKY